MNTAERILKLLKDAGVPERKMRVSPATKWPLQNWGVAASDVKHQDFHPGPAREPSRHITMIELMTSDIGLTADLATIIASCAILIAAIKS